MGATPVVLLLLAVACGRISGGGAEASTTPAPSSGEIQVVEGGPPTPPVPFITDDRVVLLQDREGGAMTLRLVDPATGADLATVDLARAGVSLAGSPLLRVSSAGSWVGDRVVSEGVAPTETGTVAGIVTIEVGSDGLRPVQALALPVERFPMGAYDPRFPDASGSRFVAWAPVPGGGGEAKGQRYVYLDCRLETSRCVQGPPVSDRIFNPVYNPSRPSPAAPGG